MTKTITTRAPATLANLGSGFDVLWLAMHDPGDRVSVQFNPHNRIRLTLTGEGVRELPQGRENVAVFVCEQFCQRLGITQGVDIDLQKGVPISSGIGRSAASSVATLMALNHLFDLPLSDNELVELAMQGEAHISGALHADNVAPSLLGGLVLVADYLQRGEWRERPAVATLSNAMDVARPSNWARIEMLCKSFLKALRNDLWACSVDDIQTLEAMRTVYQRYHYIADPHTAVAFAALDRFKDFKVEGKDLPAIIVATAHPAKLPETVSRALGVQVDMPESLQRLVNLPKQIPLSTRYSAFKESLASTT